MNLFSFIICLTAKRYIKLFSYVHLCFSRKPLKLKISTLTSLYKAVGEKAIAGYHVYSMFF